MLNYRSNNLTPNYNTIFDTPSCLHQTGNQLARNVESQRSNIGQGLTIAGQQVPSSSLMPGVSISEDSVITPICRDNGTEKSHAREDDERVLQRKMANHYNLLEQALLIDADKPSTSVDTASKLVMTNLTEDEPEIYSNPRSAPVQKSILGGRTLQITDPSTAK